MIAWLFISGIHYSWKVNGIGEVIRATVVSDHLKATETGKDWELYKKQNYQNLLTNWL